MKTYKVIKSFGTAKKGDIFTMDEDGIYSMERKDEHKNGASVSWVQMQMSQDIINDFVEKGFMEEIKQEDTEKSDNKLQAISDYVNTLIDTYTKSYDDMLESFNNGDVPTCVKVEAETVYYNMIKVLNSIKNKINE